MTSAFDSFLASRSAGQVEIAPGITTPRAFGDPHREHLATRRAGGLFDFSFMGCTAVAGPGALACVDALQTRRLDRLPCGRIAYTLLLRDDGSVLNDATVWRVGRDLFWIFTGRRSDHANIGELGARFDVELAVRSDSHAFIAVQGDVSRSAIERCFAGSELAALPYFGFRQARFAGAECWIARLGYSGEAGYELVVAADAAPGLWQALCAGGADAGLLECGFEAADSLRIEAGHILFTRELASPVSPFEIGLSRFVDCDGREFRGSPALRARRLQVPRVRLAGLVPPTDAEASLCLPAQLAQGSAVMTSTCWSPLLERRIGIGFVNAEDAYAGTAVRLSGGACARVARLPFYDPTRRLPRRSC